jgi:Arc/MetJ family transcription regulator
MRTTIEIRDEYRARLVEIAARRGVKGFSTIVEEALESYLGREGGRDETRRRALAVRGALSGEEAEELARRATAVRKLWR